MSRSTECCGLSISECYDSNLWREWHDYSNHHLTGTEKIHNRRCVYAVTWIHALRYKSNRLPMISFPNFAKFFFFSNQSCPSWPPGAAFNTLIADMSHAAHSWGTLSPTHSVLFAQIFSSSCDVPGIPLQPTWTDSCQSQSAGSSMM